MDLLLERNFSFFFFSRMLEIVSNYETIRNLHRVLEHAIKFHSDFHVPPRFFAGKCGGKDENTVSRTVSINRLDHDSTHVAQLCGAWNKIYEKLMFKR